uniref:F-box domain-containing protein n=1 Tax=Triticum urartu TaxID=4572 RepID=A0A8R7TCH5_TRIUA
MSSPPSPPPARRPPPTRTTICALGEDLLREILARLPDLPNLDRAAFTCHAFLRAVRSSPAFRRRFRSLRAPPLLAFFVEREMDAVPVYPSPWRPSDPGLAGAFRDADFLQTRSMRCPPADHGVGLQLERRDPHRPPEAASQLQPTHASPGPLPRHPDPAGRQLP